MLNEKLTALVLKARDNLIRINSHPEDEVAYLYQGKTETAACIAGRLFWAVSTLHVPNLPAHQYTLYAEQLEADCSKLEIILTEMDCVLFQLEPKS